jgi:hypothetical protein
MIELFEDSKMQNLNPFDATQCCESVTFWYGTDPDPCIRTTDLRIWILLFSPVAFRMRTKNIFFFFQRFFATNFLKVYLYHSSLKPIIKHIQKEKLTLQSNKIVVLRVLFLHLGRVWYNYYDTAKTTLGTTTLLTVDRYLQNFLLFFLFLFKGRFWI